MVRPSYGPQAQKQASRLLEALLTYANDELDACYRLKIEFNWQLENQLIVRTTVRHLELLVSQVFKDLKLTGEQIKEALRRYKDFLEILEDQRTKTQGSDDWHFKLMLWFGRHERAANLQRFDEEWERRREERSRQVIKAIAASQQGIVPSEECLEVDRLVQLIREKVFEGIQVRCGYMRVLEMSQPLGLEAIYTTVNIYESIRGRQRRGLADLLQQASIAHLDQQKSRISGLAALEQYSKLIIFGKPGAGKTTFLKWLAIQCNNGHFWKDLIPVFISAKAFAEAKGQPELLSYIHKQWADCGVMITQIEELLQRGRALILIDGLDEVREADYYRVLQEIREFSTHFHKCLFVMTCRIAAQEYTFEQFTEVEIADFDDQQITGFATQWFEAKNDPAKTGQFLKKLYNQQRIRELATNPLLLTLLCLVFQESVGFPSNRSELYREGLEILLRTWDAKRNIERDGLYRKLSLQCKKALLSEIAFITFERGEYFFKRQTIEQYITDFLRTLPALNNKLEPLEIDGEAVLRSIQAQHGLLLEQARGIYSFSHLTFHEYFTAKKIIDSPADQLQAALQALAKHVADQEWQEVFLLTANMLQSADILLLVMKTQIDRILSSDAKLQQFLSWLNERAIFAINNGRSHYKPVTVRAYYSCLLFENVNIRANAGAIASTTISTREIYDRVMDFSSISDYQSAIASRISSANDSGTAIAIAIVISSSINTALELDIESTITLLNAIDRAIALSSETGLKEFLQDLKAQLPNPEEDILILNQWWKNHGYSWANKLRDVQIRVSNLTYDWSFSEAQITLLNQYYRANLLLVDCLLSDCAVTPVVRDEIEGTLLLSMEDIEQHKKTHQQEFE